MNKIKDSVWQQNEDGNWNLYFNIESDNIQKSLSTESDISKSKKSNIVVSDPYVLGTLIMTPNGIGRLIKIDQDYGFIKHKQDSQEKKYAVKDLLTSFTCFITINMIEGNEEIVRIKIKPQGKVEDIFDQLEKMKKISKNENTYSLITNGTIINKDFSFEQLDIKNNCKMLLTLESKIKYTISRFKVIGQYWYTNVIDGITFDISKPIRLIGVGIYGSHEGKIIQSKLKILAGDSSTSPLIFEESITVAPSPNKIMAVNSIYFSKPVKLNTEQKYSIVLDSRTNTNSYYGQQGKAVVEGEKGIIFHFYRIKGRNGGTDVDKGNIPEFYYYLN